MRIVIHLFIHFQRLRFALFLLLLLLFVFFPSLSGRPPRCRGGGAL